VAGGPSQWRSNRGAAGHHAGFWTGAPKAKSSHFESTGLSIDIFGATPGCCWFAAAHGSAYASSRGAIAAPNPQRVGSCIKRDAFVAVQELPRLEDLFASTFEVACRDGVPDDAGALKRLRVDLESILKEANKRQKLLAMELTKLYDIVEDPPEIEQTTDPVLLQAWRDKTTAEINEVARVPLGPSAAHQLEGQCRPMPQDFMVPSSKCANASPALTTQIEELERTQREEAAAAAQAAKAAAAARPSPAAVPRATPHSRAPAARGPAARGRSMMCAPRPGLAPQIREKPNPLDARAFGIPELESAGRLDARCDAITGTGTGRPWPAGLPFIWRDSMRVNFHVGGY